MFVLTSIVLNIFNSFIMHFLSLKLLMKSRKFYWPVYYIFRLKNNVFFCVICFLFDIHFHTCLSVKMNKAICVLHYGGLVVLLRAKRDLKLGDLIKHRRKPGVAIRNNISVPLAAFLSACQCRGLIALTEMEVGFYSALPNRRIRG